MHIVFEAILGRLLESTTDLEDDLKHWDWSFSSKLKAAYNRKVIDCETFNVFYKINKIRNRIAHEFDQSLKYDEIYDLAISVNENMDGDMFEGYDEYRPKLDMQTLLLKLTNMYVGI